MRLREAESRPAAPRRFYAGLDLGQASDFSALSLVEETERPAQSTLFRLQGLKRWELKTPYPDIVEDTQRLLRQVPGDCRLFLDVTGCGRPVADMFRRAKIRFTGILIHGGERATYDKDENSYHVPKRDLAAALAVLLQQDRLQLPEALALLKVLKAELAAFKVKISTAGHDQYGADWREAPNDDLVLSLACAVWWALRHGGGVNRYDREAGREAARQAQHLPRDPIAAPIFDPSRL